MLTKAQFEQIARAFYEHELECDETLRSQWRHAPEKIALLREEMAERDSKLQEIEFDLANGGDRQVSSRAIMLMEDLGLTPEGQMPEDDDENYNQLCHYLLRAFKEVTLRAKERDQGDFGGTPKDKLFLDPAPSDAASARAPYDVLSPQSSASVAQLTPAFINDAHLDEAEGKTRRSYLRTLDYFDEFLDSKPIGEIVRQDVVDFVERLKLMPKNFRVKLGTDSLLEAIELNRTRALPVILEKTLRDKYISNIRCFLAWAFSKNYIPDDFERNLRLRRQTAGWSQQEVGLTRKKRLAFEPRHLEKIFKAPLYTGCRSHLQTHHPGVCRPGDHRFWMPLLGLFTGCRMNELGQLRVSDIVTRYGREVLRIAYVGDPEDPDHPSEQRVAIRGKTPAATRTVPLHRQLIEIGFLDYVRTIEEQGYRRLFPGWRLGCDGTYSYTYSKYFARFCHHLKITQTEYVYHSFRHNFVAALTEAGVAKDFRMRLLGHAAKDVHDGYGTQKLLQIDCANVDKVRYEGLDLSHLDWRRTTLPALRRPTREKRKKARAQKLPEPAAA